MLQFLDFFSILFYSRVIFVHADEKPIIRRHNGICTRVASKTVWVIGVVDIINRK